MKKVFASLTNFWEAKVFLLPTKKVWWQETDEIEEFAMADSFHQPFYEKY